MDQMNIVVERLGKTDRFRILLRQAIAVILPRSPLHDTFVCVYVPSARLHYTTWEGYLGSALSMSRCTHVSFSTY